jgi:DNA-binding NarL/FixJ family response regulator
MGEPLHVTVVAPDPVLEAGAMGALASYPDVAVVPWEEAANVAVVVVDGVAQALDIVRTVKNATHRPEVVLVVADLAPADALRAIAAGVRGLLRRREASPDRLARAVLAAASGDCTVPPDMLDGLLEFSADGRDTGEKARHHPLVPAPRPSAGEDARVAGTSSDARVAGTGEGARGAGGAAVTGTAEGTTERLRVHVTAADAAARSGVLTLVQQAGIALVPEPDRSPATVVVAAASTVDRAIAAFPATCLSGEHRLLVVADRFTPAGVLRAVRVGVRAMLQSTGATPAQLGAAVQSAQSGDGRIPYTTLVRLLSGAPEEPVPAAGPPTPSPLTARQTAVLALMAEGHSNAGIACALSCSEHTVKNVIYDLMARLLVSNRAQAVARAIRAGLI